MPETVLFIIEAEASAQQALQKRFMQVKKTLEEIKSALLLTEQGNADLDALYAKARALCDATDETLFVTNIPAFVTYLAARGDYAAGLIEQEATGASFPGCRYLFAEFEEVDKDSYVKTYERLSGRPWHILETQRLLVRESTVEDVDAFYRIYADERMTEYMEGLFADPADEKRYMADYIEKVYALMGFGVWTVLRKDTKEIIGRAGFSLRGGFTDPELGFLIGTAYQTKGYAQEVCQAVLAYGKTMLSFERVQALVKAENAVSVHLLNKLGFAPAETVNIEEQIYGSDYQSGRRQAFNEIKYGSYLLMRKTLV